MRPPDRGSDVVEETCSIRPAAREDCAPLLAIFNEARRHAGLFAAGYADMDGFLRETAGEEIHLAELDGRVIGFVSVWLPENFIHHLFVSPAFHNRGAGHALLSLCIARYGLPLSLKCTLGNTRAYDFYIRNGWEPKAGGVGEDGPWAWLWLDRPPQVQR